MGELTAKNFAQDKANEIIELKFGNYKLKSIVTKEMFKSVEKVVE